MAGIYIHIPFCKQACHYCDFHFSTSQKNRAEMVLALQKELQMRKSEIDEPVETIYFGGGTPSVLLDAWCLRGRRAWFAADWSADSGPLKNR